MATLGGTPLTGSPAAHACTAIAVELSAPPRASAVHVFGADWEVELRSDNNYAVARSLLGLVGSALVDNAIDIIHRALDLASVVTSDNLITIMPADNHITVEPAQGGVALRLRAIADWGMAMDVEITHIRADGTVEPAPPPPALQWIPAFRFFRLSQGSRDLFDAFRNLFLGLEALLDHLFPKQRNEREKEWILRALTDAAAQSDFSNISIGGGAVPLNALVNELYDVRVHLFHAKTGRVLIPDELVSYLKVAEAYPALLAVWTELLRGWMPTRRGSGAVTYGGFRFLFDKGYADSVVAVGRQTSGTRWPSVPDEAAQHDWTLLPSPAILAEVRPGRMAVIGRGAVSRLSITGPVNRVAVMNAEHQPMILGSFPDLTLEGIDEIETVTVIRMVNLGLPRTEFS
jgi:hypothetical protein